MSKKIVEHSIISSKHGLQKWFLNILIQKSIQTLENNSATQESFIDKYYNSKYLPTNFSKDKFEKHVLVHF